MAALLVALSVMSVMMTVAMPVWKQMSQREKEAELVFRGEQYARAIELMQRKIPGALPPNVDLLVDQKFLRKKYKDPITGDDFATLTPAQTVTAPATSARPGQTATAPARGAALPTPQPATGRAATVGGVQGGIIGVVSKSKDESIRIYKGRTHYNEWVFQAQPRTQTPGAGAPGVGAPGRGGPGQQPGGGVGGRGQPDGGRGGRGPGNLPPGR